MLVVKNIKKKFIKCCKDGKTREFYANDGISFEASEG